MAFNLSAILTFSQKGFQKGLGRASKSFDKFNTRVKKAGAQARAMGPGLRNVGLMGTGMAAGIGVAVKSYMDFSRQMDSVAAKMSDGKQHYNEMSDLAKQMGSTTIFTSKQAAQGLEYLALAGFGAKDAMGVLPTLLYTAGAGALELGAASDIITDSMSALAPIMGKFGDKTKQATALSDMMALAQARSNTNIEQLGEAIKYGGGALANLGIPLHEVIGSMGALADAGIKGSMGGTALVNMMNKLAKPSSKAKGLMEKMGISMEDIKYRAADGTMRLKSMSEVMSVFEKALKKNPDLLNRAGVATEIFGLRGQRAFFALQNKGAANLNKLYSELDKSEGAAKKMYTDMTDNLYGAWESIKSAVSGSILNLGELFSKMFDAKGALQAITKPISDFAMAIMTVMKPTEDWSEAQKRLMQTGLGQFVLGMVDGFKLVKQTVVGVINIFKGMIKTASKSGFNFRSFAKIATMVAMAIAAIGPPILMIGGALLLLTPVVSAVISGVGLLGSVLALLASPITLVIAGVALLTYGLYKLMGGWEGITSAVKTFAAGFWEAFKPAWEAIKVSLMPTINMLKETFSELFKTLGFGSKGASSDLTSFGQTVGKVVGFIAKVLVYPIKAIAHLINLFAKLATFGAGVAKDVLGWFGFGKGKKAPIEMGEVAKGMGEPVTPPEGKKATVIDFEKARTRLRPEEQVGLTPEERERRRQMSVAEQVNKQHLAATQVRVAPSNVNVITPAAQTTTPQVNIQVNNEVDENGIRSMVQKSERHESNKQGTQLQTTSAERQSQVSYGR